MDKVNERVIRKIFKLPEDQGVLTGTHDLETILDSKDEDEESRAVSRERMEECSKRADRNDDSITQLKELEDCMTNKDQDSILEKKQSETITP